MKLSTKLIYNYRGYYNRRFSVYTVQVHVVAYFQFKTQTIGTYNLNASIQYLNGVIIMQFSQKIG